MDKVDELNKDVMTIHSNEGAYTKPQKYNHIRLKSGAMVRQGLKNWINTALIIIS